MLSVTLAEFCKLPDVPVMVIGYVPAAVELDVVTVTVEEADPASFCCSSAPPTGVPIARRN